MIAYKLTEFDEACCQRIAHAPGDEVKEFIAHRKHLAFLATSRRVWDSNRSQYSYSENPAAGEHAQWIAARHMAMAARVHSLSSGCCDDFRPAKRKSRFSRAA